MKTKGLEITNFLLSLDTKNMTMAEIDAQLDKRFPNLVRTDWSDWSVTKPHGEEETPVK